ncbi:carotenoid ester lipase precursor [Mycena floridula]|nr:carotenoid ester lipase precursor [Mycena floridula]
MRASLAILLAITAITDASNIVTLPYATYRGNTAGNLTQFLGMRFAEPPIDDLRFRRPVPPLPVKGIQNAFNIGPACPQQTLSTLPFINFPSNINASSEDCLTINVWRPIGSVKPLPVMLWIHGGGFEIGDSTDQSPLSLVERSIAIGEPIMFVTANYRLSGLGFLGGQAVHEAGIANLGLHDQRLALKWVQQYIALFGGDPGRVIISGPSAGAISVAIHMLIDAGANEKLYHGAFMLSGGPVHIDSTSEPRYQDAYDQIVRETDCTGTKDAIACLRKVPFEKLWPVINGTTNVFSYSSLSNIWRPTVDGTLLKHSTLCSVAQGHFNHVPIINGDADDEGSIFSLSNTNITKDAEFLEYMQTYLLAGATSAQIQQAAAAYPADLSAGSPFDTGETNALTPEYKRLAAIQGDIVFQAPRRLFLQANSQEHKSWAYITKIGKSTPILGSFHGSDINIWLATDPDQLVGADAIIHFVNTLDPNGKDEVVWPQWSASSPNLLTFSDPSNVSITADTFRADAMNLLNEIQIDIENELGLC